jgi:hypothetical protein
MSCLCCYFHAKTDDLFLYDYLNNSMQQSRRWKADSYSASQDIPRLLRNTKIHYRVHKSLPLIPILSQMNSVHKFTQYCPKIHSNIILPSVPMSSAWSLPFRFSDQCFYAFIISPMPATCPVHLILLYLITIIYGEVYSLWSSSLSSVLQPPTISSLLDPNIINTMFSNTFSVCSSLSIRGCIQKFPDWPPGFRTANGTALCH